MFLRTTCAGRGDERKRVARSHAQVGAATCYVRLAVSYSRPRDVQSMGPKSGVEDSGKNYLVGSSGLGPPGRSPGVVPCPRNRSYM